MLASNDAEMQLTWAQDALMYVEISMQNEQRISATQPARTQTPKIEHVLREDAAKVVEFLADQHHPQAEFLRGTWLEFAKFGHRIDKKEAFHCYTSAADRGYARAYYRIGMQFESSNDSLKAIMHYQRGADAGDAACCYRLGMMALLGQHGQPQDFQRGLDYIHVASEAADEGAPQGAYVLGMLQARQLAQISIPERFQPLDLVSARVNLERAAFLGFGKAQVKMASAYELGELGCGFDPALSLHYNALAARQGEAEAEMAISKWFLCGQEGVFEKNEEMAFTYAQRAAVSGMATAQFAMGYFYEVGIYVPVNFKEAKEWYGRAEGSGNKDASTRIDSISRSKTLSRKDHESLAVSKIRRGHGSRGPALAAVVEDDSTQALDMPDPSRLTLGPPVPNRAQSSTPYPENDIPLSSNIYGPAGTNRPNSAFGINPNLRQHQSPNPQPIAQRQYAPPKPAYTPSWDGYSGRGRGSDPRRGQPGPRHGRYGSGDGKGERFSPAPTPPLQQSGRGQGPVQQTPPAVPPKAAVTPTAIPQPPKMDIGFSAPLDMAGADKQRRWEGTNATPNATPSATPNAMPGTRPIIAGSAPMRGKVVPVSAQENRFYATQTTYTPVPGIQAANITPSRPSASPAPAFTQAKPSKVSANTEMQGQGFQPAGEMAIPSKKGDSECVSGFSRAGLSEILTLHQIVM